jgi:hypothetical protein
LELKLLGSDEKSENDLKIVVCTPVDTLFAIWLFLRSRRQKQNTIWTLLVFPMFSLVYLVIVHLALISTDDNKLITDKPR